MKSSEKPYKGGLEIGTRTYFTVGCLLIGFFVMYPIWLFTKSIFFVYGFFLFCILGLVGYFSFAFYPDQQRVERRRETERDEANNNVQRERAEREQANSQEEFERQSARGQREKELIESLIHEIRGYIAKGKADAKEIGDSRWFSMLLLFENEMFKPVFDSYRANKLTGAVAKQKFLELQDDARVLSKRPQSKTSGEGGKDSREDDQKKNYDANNRSKEESDPFRILDKYASDLKPPLHITSNSSESQVKTAWKLLSLKWHPDQFKDGDERVKELATERIKEINGAWSRIKENKGWT